MIIRLFEWLTKRLVWILSAYVVALLVGVEFREHRDALFWIGMVTWALYLASMSVTAFTNYTVFQSALGLTLAPALVNGLIVLLFSPNTEIAHAVFGGGFLTLAWLGMLKMGVLKKRTNLVLCALFLVALVCFFLVHAH